MDKTDSRRLIPRRQLLIASAASLAAAAMRRALAQDSAPGAAGATAPQQAFSEMSIARIKAPDQLPEEEIAKAATQLTEKAIANLGGMERFVKRGDVVCLKPNIGFKSGPEAAANTNPDVVATLVKLCLNAGAKRVKVCDNSCFGARDAYPWSGIEDAVRAAGGDIVYLDNVTPKEMDLQGERLAVWPVFQEIVESDLVINVPVLKQHMLSQLSCCFKNYMGAVGGPRHLWHRDLPSCLVDMAAFMKPRLTVVDAVRSIIKHGPEGAGPKDVKLMGIVAAGTDPVALEAFGAEQIGLDPAEGRAMKLAQARGLGQIDYHALPLADVFLE